MCAVCGVQGNCKRSKAENVVPEHENKTSDPGDIASHSGLDYLDLYLPWL